MALEHEAESDVLAARRTGIFVSYSHHDKKYVKEGGLIDFLRGLERDGADFWWDARLTAGDVWDDEIKARILDADVVVALVSQWFLDSAYIRTDEVRLFLERMREHALTIVPVILSPCDWQKYAWLTRLQHLPEGDRTIAQHFSRPGAREGMYLRIRDALRKKLKGHAPAERAIMATAGSISLINSLDQQFREVAGVGSSGDHSLVFEGLGDRLRIVDHRHERFLGADDLRHLETAELEGIVAQQRKMRAHYENWIARYERRSESVESERQLWRCSAEMLPDLRSTIHELQRFGLYLDDHYLIFMNLVQSVADRAE